MEPRSGIAAFVRQTRVPRVLARVCTCAVAEVVVWVAAAWLIEVVAPSYATWVWVGGAVWIGSAAVWRFATDRVSVAALDREFDCRDALRTWVALEDADRTTDPRVVGWLEASLSGHLASIPSAVRRAEVRRRLRPLRVLVPLLIAVLILRWLEPTFMPPLGGGAGGGGGLATGAGDATEGDGGGDAPGPPGGDGQPQPGDEGDPDPIDTSPQPAPPGEPDENGSEEQEAPAGDQPDDTEPPPAEVPPPPGEDDQPDPSPEPDGGDDTPLPLGQESPLLDMALRDDFVIPQFVGEGPSSAASAHVAEVGAPDAIPARPAPPDGGGVSRAGARGEGESPPDEPPAEFERAAERAQRSRHVQQHERPVVRRYFELLLRGRKPR